MSIRVLDLYSGMGGLSLGFLLAWKVPVTGVDKDKYAVETYNYNLNKLNGRAIKEDILKWKPEEYYDVIIGGPPCQPFSLAVNPKRGKVVKNHPLFETFPRFIELIMELKPKAFLMENVKGLVSRRSKNIFLKYIKELEADYNITYRVLNSAFYGVPQRRERLFTIGIRKDLGIIPSLPKETHGENKRIKWVTVREAIGDIINIPPIIREREHITIALSKHAVERIKKERENRERHWGSMVFPDDQDKPSRTISSHTIAGSKRETIIIQVEDHEMTKGKGWVNSDWGRRIIKLDKPSYTITEKHRSGQLVELPSKEWVKKHSPISLDKPSNPIASNTGKNKKWVHNSIIDSSGYRRLTVRECLRLQSFPDWWSFPPNISVSRKYKLVGEAVPPILAYRLAVHLGKQLGVKIYAPPVRDEWSLPFFHRSFQDYLQGETK